MMRIGVLASGSGSNLQAILDACAHRSIPAQVAAVISNVAGARALSRAEEAGVPALLLAHGSYSSRDAYDAEMVSLLPAYPGMHAVRQALKGGARVSGCTVHIVDEGTDTGPILIQAAVPVLDGDTEETLAARILVQEHRCYPRAISLMAEGRVEIDGRRVRIKGANADPTRTLSSPEITD